MVNLKPQRPKLLALAVIFVISLSCASPGAAADILVAAASDLNFAMKDMITAYRKTSGDRVKLSLGSSGNFYSQIQNGAPFDLYFSADVGYPQKLERAGYVVPGTRYRYAIGRIVLWVPAQSPLAVTQLGMQVLLDPTIRKIAIANPRHAPYGQAAKAALVRLNLYDRVRDKLVLGDNISQAAQFVESGASDIGVIALSLALAPPMKARGRYWMVPTDAYPLLEQAAVVVKGGRNPKGAKDFLAFVRGPTGQAIMRRYGFTAPEAASRR